MRDSKLFQIKVERVITLVLFITLVILPVMMFPNLFANNSESVANLDQDSTIKPIPSPVHTILQKEPVSELEDYILEKLTQAKKDGMSADIVIWQSALDSLYGIDSACPDSDEPDHFSEKEHVGQSFAFDEDLEWSPDIEIDTSPGDQKACVVTSSFDGTLFCAYESDDGAHPFTWIKIKRSTNHGDSWQSWGGCYSDNYALTAPDIIVAEGEQDWVIVVYESVGNIRIYQKSYPDGGVTSFSTVDNLENSLYRPRICSDDYWGYYLYCTYLCYEDGTAGFSRSIDYGDIWNNHIYFGTAHSNSDVDYGDSGLWITYQSGYNFADDTNIYIRNSTNFGNGWSVAHDVSSFGDAAYPMIVADEDSDHVVVTYNTEWNATDHDIRYSHSTNSEDWYSAILLDFSVADSKFPYLTSGLGTEVESQGEPEYMVVWWEEGAIMLTGSMSEEPEWRIEGDPNRTKEQLNENENASSDDRPCIVQQGWGAAPTTAWGMAVWIENGGSCDVYGSNHPEPVSVADITNQAFLTYDLLITYPNPFNLSTTVAVTLPEAANLKVEVVNIAGQQVAELADGRYAAGKVTMTFDASNLSSGVYFIHATVPGHMNEVQKVMLVR